MTSTTWEQDIIAASEELKKSFLNRDIDSRPSAYILGKTGPRIRGAVDEDVRLELNKINETTANTELELVGDFGQSIKAFARDTHTADDWEKKINDESDKAAKKFKRRVDKARDDAIQKIRTLPTPEDQQNATDLYKDGMKYVGFLSETFGVEFDMILHGVVEIVKEIRHTVEAVGKTINAAAEGIISVIRALF